MTPHCPRLSLLGLLMLAVPLSTAATTAGPTAAPSAPPASRYIESPQPSVTTVTSYAGPYYSGPSYGYYDGFHRGGGYYPGFYDVHTYQPRRYFFPPKPPALGEAYLRNRTKSSSLVRSAIPLALSDYVNEPFYSPLSPFLYEESLSRKRQKMLDDYRTARLALVEELRATLRAVAGLDEDAREAKLAEFAREQTPRVAAVEKTGYDIRDDLTHWSLFSSASNWNEGREWRLGDNTRWESTLDEAKAMRGYAYFQNGLSPAQRRLLRELSMELDDSGREPTADISLTSPGPWFYFSPEMSRIRLPANLPPDLAAKISLYREQKDALKRELRETVYREDRGFFESRRAAAMRSLADRQADRIEALEPLAEEIRKGLIRLPNASQPLMPTLTTALGARTSAYLRQTTDLRQTLNTRLNELRRQFPDARVEFVRIDAGIGIQMVADRRMKAADRPRFDQALNELLRFNTEQIDRYARLVQEKQSLRAALVLSAGPLASLMTDRTIDFMLREVSVALVQQELWHRYHEYEIAVLQPGLSPEQRRLLFDAALVSLDQQLPGYTY
ncbi:MAG TPA: hypothetical protein VHE61_23125 [Opitutaceae bacterium]|nr:hypothetical protein [Opitutaceae bacterium]